MIFLDLSSVRKGEALSAPPCTSVGSLVPVPLCAGSFPEGARMEQNQSCGWKC